MTDILNKEIVGYEEACYLKEMGFNGECTGYYHCDDYGCEDLRNEEDRYECVGWHGLYRNSFSIYRAAAPSVRAAKLWYTKNKVTPFKETHKSDNIHVEMTHGELQVIVESLLCDKPSMSSKSIAKQWINSIIKKI